MVLTKTSFNDYKPIVILIPHSRIWSREMTILEIGQKLQVWDKVMSSRDRFKEEKPQNLTPKFVEDMVAEVQENNKITQMFKAMAIVNLKMGNLCLEVQSLKTKLTIVEKEKHGLLRQMKKKQEGYEEYKK